MWPLVQADDGCWFHPIQAVTAKKDVFSVVKEESVIRIGASACPVAALEGSRAMAVRVKLQQPAWLEDSRSLVRLATAAPCCSRSHAVLRLRRMGHLS